MELYYGFFLGIFFVVLLCLGFSYTAFIDMLDIEAGLALRLQSFFDSNAEGKKLKNVEGIDDVVIQKMKKIFNISEDYL